MIDESKCYELLGVTAGASRQELKAAHRDLAKVWHPDRFAHDPRLQAKAQEKLKEINEAYDQVTTGKAKRRMATPPPDRTPRYEDAYWRSDARRSGEAVARRPFRWSLALLPLLIFGVAFFFTSRLLIRRSQQSAVDPVSVTEEVPPQALDEGQQSGRNELPRGKTRSDEMNEGEDVNAGTALQQDAPALQPMATATVTIDPTTGMLARRECPAKSTMTYPKGNEPHQYCSVHLPLEPAQPEVQRLNESRIKSVAKRLASPGKWFDGKEKSDAGSKQDVKTP
ncbi:MAG: J domain-containing protein [Pyrinomonadaceae bacterium]